MEFNYYSYKTYKTFKTSYKNTFEKSEKITSIVLKDNQI